MLESPRADPLMNGHTAAQAAEMHQPVRPYSAMGDMFGGGFVPSSYHHDPYARPSPWTARTASGAWPRDVSTLLMQCGKTKERESEDWIVP